MGSYEPAEFRADVKEAMAMFDACGALEVKGVKPVLSNACAILAYLLRKFNVIAVQHLCLSRMILKIN
jgi:hypothetical protein